MQLRPLCKLPSLCTPVCCLCAFALVYIVCVRVRARVLCCVCIMYFVVCCVCINCVVCVFALCCVYYECCVVCIELFVFVCVLCCVQLGCCPSPRASSPNHCSSLHAQRKSRGLDAAADPCSSPLLPRPLLPCRLLYPCVLYHVGGIYVHWLVHPSAQAMTAITLSRLFPRHKAGYTQERRKTPDITRCCFRPPRITSSVRAIRLI